MTTLQNLGEWLCHWWPTHRLAIAHDLRRNGRIILECRKSRPVFGPNRNCWSTANNISCDYLEHGCRACFEPFWLSIMFHSVNSVKILIKSVVNSL